MKLPAMVTEAEMEEPRMVPGASFQHIFPIEDSLFYRQAQQDTESESEKAGVSEALLNTCHESFRLMGAIQRKKRGHVVYLKVSYFSKTPFMSCFFLSFYCYIGEMLVQSIG